MEQHIALTDMQDAEWVWVADGIEVSPDRGASSAMASNRYRVLLPLGGLVAAGAKARVMSFSVWLQTPPEALSACRAVVIGKLLPFAGQVLPASHYDAVIAHIRLAQLRGIKVLADFCDDHFDRPADGHYWRRLAQSVDTCVAGSDAMADRIARVSRNAICVVGDPVAAPRKPARVFRPQASAGNRLLKWVSRSAAQERRLQLVWFGHPSNWHALKPWAEALAKAEGLPPLMFWVVSSPEPGLVAFVEQFGAAFAASARMELVPWTETDQWDVLAGSDVVLLPAGLEDPRKAVKTANRLIDGIMSGCHVIASPVPAYAPYADCVSLTIDPVAALRNYLAHTEQALQDIQRGQTVVDALAGMDAVVRQWLAAFDRALAAQSALPDLPVQPEGIVPKPLEPIRLNIGCGDKILPGYINVDVVQSRAGKKPDVIADVRDLRVFETCYADEVMAVHVVEHFWRWEVEDVVREWIRVLKPGGLLVLECPNLLSACEALLADPTLAARSDQAGQRSMWVFYGDPQWKDPLMIHRWGYTPQSLKDLLCQLGLVDVRQEPAQFKLREPRDMRIVGVKP
jgi:hypothetical protein